MWEWAHWLTGRRTRLRAHQPDLAPITHTPGFTKSGDMAEPSPPDSQSTGQPLDTHNTYTGLTAWFGSEPHLGDDEAVMHPTIGIAARLGYQHILSISPPDENIVQQLKAPRPRVHPRGVLPRRKAEEGVGQQETVFRTRAQKKEAVIVTATVTVGTQPSLPGSVVCPDAGIEVNEKIGLITIPQIVATNARLKSRTDEILDGRHPQFGEMLLLELKRLNTSRNSGDEVKEEGEK
ncbi:unnamed protein product [Schistocephalus solidus]|uniref:Uncharacterized protein n=1 Tax=Schistocephalus solidus TaxID=70667 RepID=A0A183TEL0_SCHSO|nr:unnamed protein product [Schistocephalus solidus]